MNLDTLQRINYRNVSLMLQEARTKDLAPWYINSVIAEAALSNAVSFVDYGDDAGWVGGLVLGEHTTRVMFTNSTKSKRVSFRFDGNRYRYSIKTLH